MPYYKFGKNDIFYNTLEAHPKCKFLVHDGKTYYNEQIPELAKNKDGNYTDASGATYNVDHVESGEISLYEINVNRREHCSDASYTNETDCESNSGVWLTEPLAYPFINKDGTALAFKTVDKHTYQEFPAGDEISGQYPLAAGITVEKFDSLSPNFSIDSDLGSGGVEDAFIDEKILLMGEQELDGTLIEAGLRPHIIALKNTINSYSVYSPYFNVVERYTRKLNPAYNGKNAYYLKRIVANPDFDSSKMVDWDYGKMTLISIPSIFFGSSIEKGSVSLKRYVSGELSEELTDANKNGELLRDNGDKTTTLTGVVLYNEGFIILFGDTFTGNNLWLSWGKSDNGVTIADTLSFNGTNRIPTLTMLAHAGKGELNHSNNPTYLTYNQDDVNIVSTKGTVYAENKDLTIANTVKSPHSDFEAPLEKQTWISKIGIYDENNNLIAIAKLANPVRKTEGRDFTFKLKLDI